MTILNSPGRILLGTAALVTALVFFGLVFANPETCPFDYTQEQVEATGCSVGANIGLGLVFLLAATIAIVGIVLAITARSANEKTPAW